MHRARIHGLVLVVAMGAPLLLATGCSDDGTSAGTPPTDSGPSEADSGSTAQDAARELDAAFADASPADNGTLDASPVDAGMSDTGAPDTGARDATALDGAVIADSGADAGSGDVGVVSDAGIAVNCGALIEAETRTSTGTNDSVATATALSISTSGGGTTTRVFAGELQNENDRDFFSFNVAYAGARLRVGVATGGNGMDAMVGIRDAEGNLFRVGADPLSNDVSREIFLPFAGTYYLQVVSNVALAPRNYCYAISFETLPAPAPALIELPSGSTTSTRAFSVTESGNIGYFRVRTAGGGFLSPYVFNLAAPAARQASGQDTRLPDVDALVTIWDPAEHRVVAENDDAPGRSNANTFATLTSSAGAKDYWIIVDHFVLQNEDASAAMPSGALEDELTLSIDEPISAAALPFFDGIHALSAERSVQWYLVNALPGNEVSAAIDGAGGGLLDVVVGAIDASGVSLAVDAPQSSMAMVEQVPIGSDRTLIGVASFDDLFNPSAGVTGDYAMAVDVLGGCRAIAGAPRPDPGDLALNEVLWDPPPGVSGDANGDGVRGGQEDEFAEIVNVTSGRLDVGGVSLEDSSGVAIGTRLVVPCGIEIGPMEALVVFGGGTPVGAFGGSLVGISNVTLDCASTAPARSLCLNNSTSEAVVLRAAPVAGATPDTGVELARTSFASASPDAAFVRCVNATPVDTEDCDIGTVYVQHNAIPTVTTVFSPGTKTDGTPFGVIGDRCDLPTDVPAQGLFTAETTLGYRNDMTPDPLTCASGFSESGPDHVYSVLVPAGQELGVMVTPEISFDVAVYALPAPSANCEPSGAVCLAGADDGIEGDPEFIAYRNSTTVAEVVFVIVDGPAAVGGAYDLEVSIVP